MKATPNNNSLNDEKNLKKENYIHRNTLAIIQLIQCQVMLFQFIKPQFFLRRPTHLCLLYQTSIMLMLLCLSVVDKSLVTSR